MARLAAGLEKKLIEDVKAFLAADPDRAVAAAISIGALCPMLHSFEIGQHFAIGPTPGTLLHPSVVVPRIAAQEHHAVNQRGATEADAARMVDDPAVEMGLWHRVVPAH